MSRKQKLELTWIGKDNQEYDIANIEPRILEERKDLSYGDPDTENMIILSPDNKEFDDIVLENIREDEFHVVAEFVTIL
ncbi:MAG: hypothetical protein HZA28_03665 [Candidatus Omnitrophica bacterium]|nr:hypothetical protein [Candidatus Omnitrophota bacterium]